MATTLAPLAVTPRTTAVIVSSAVTLGVIADQLLRAPLWGINVPIILVAVAAAGLAMPMREGPAAGGESGRSPWAWLAAAFFASMWAIRDTPLLLSYDLIAAASLFSLPLLQSRGVVVRLAGAVDVLTAPLRAGWEVTFGTLDFAEFAGSQTLRGRSATGHFRALGAGLLLTLPLMIVFGGLFSSADPIFDSFFASLFPNVGPLASHLILTLVLAWATAGYLWALIKPVAGEGFTVTAPPLGPIQIFMPLAATVLLFSLFVGSQASLFGGEAFVRGETGLTFADYARRGFFQLIVASSLVLPLVYVAPQVGRALEGGALRALRVLLRIQLALTGLVLVSALWRMVLYIRVYGLTEDRIYSTGFMVWIGTTLAIFAVTVVAGRPQRAAFSSLVTAVAILSALNLANPKALIARYNISHQADHALDVSHLVELGGDAVPVLTAEIDRVPAEQRCLFAQMIANRYRYPRGDWRGWNLARNRALNAALSIDVDAICATGAGPLPQ